MTKYRELRWPVAVTLGASRAAIALGVHPYQTPLDLWLDLTGQVEPFAGNERTAWGLHSELALRSWYEATQGRAIPACEPIYDRAHSFLRATPDALLDDRVVELKTAGGRQSHRWGEEGSDLIPIEYSIQVAVQMMVTDRPACDLVATIGGDPPRLYHQRRDPELEGMIRAGLVEYWTSYVLTRTPPPIDSSKSWTRYLVGRYPGAGHEYLDRPEAEPIAERIRDIRRQRAALAVELREEENLLADLIRDARGVQTTLGRITWAPKKGSVAHKRVADDLAARLGLTPDEYRTYREATRGAPTRVFYYPRWGDAE